jgi:hypothetical protein
VSLRAGAGTSTGRGLGGNLTLASGLSSGIAQAGARSSSRAALFVGPRRALTSPRVQASRARVPCASPPAPRPAWAGQATSKWSPATRWASRPAPCASGRAPDRRLARSPWRSGAPWLARAARRCCQRGRHVGAQCGGRRRAPDLGLLCGGQHRLGSYRDRGGWREQRLRRHLCEHGQGRVGLGRLVPRIGCGFRGSGRARLALRGRLGRGCRRILPSRFESTGEVEVRAGAQISSSSTARGGPLTMASGASAQGVSGESMLLSGDGRVGSGDVVVSSGAASQAASGALRLRTARFHSGGLDLAPGTSSSGADGNATIDLGWPRWSSAGSKGFWL